MGIIIKPIFTEKQTYTRGWMLILLLFLISLVALPWIVYFQGIETDIVGAVIGAGLGDIAHCVASVACEGRGG